jgi:hypothetical protein
VEISEVWLQKIFFQEINMCLIGGWAVYKTVNTSYLEDRGRPYIGSKDIDLGFHIDESWGIEELKNSDYLRFFNFLEENSFRWIGYRFYKGYDYESGRELTELEISKNPCMR